MPLLTEQPPVKHNVVASVLEAGDRPLLSLSATTLSTTFTTTLSTTTAAIILSATIAVPIPGQRSVSTATQSNAIYRLVTTTVNTDGTRTNHILPLLASVLNMPIDHFTILRCHPFVQVDPSIMLLVEPRLQ
jgi:hypothetical protein